MSHSLENTLSPTASPTAPATEPPAADQHDAIPTLQLPWLPTWIILLSLSAILSSLLVIASHGIRGFFLPILAIALCALAALFDACTSRIPNPITYPAILIGLLLNAITPLLDRLHAHNAVIWLGSAGLSSSLAGFAACAGLGLIATLLAGVHGGDLKLLAALGATLGLLQTANVMIVALSCAILYSLINLIVFGRLNSVLRRAALSALELIYFRRLHTPLPELETSVSHIPMAIPLALGLIVAQYWQFKTGGLFV